MGRVIDHLVNAKGSIILMQNGVKVGRPNCRETFGNRQRYFLQPTEQFCA
nr:MAG TPA: hypothetical protein [Caudoviricetes sp.]